MTESTQSQAIFALRKAIVKAYPLHTDLGDVPLEGSYASVWQSFARAIGINASDLAVDLAPCFGLDVAPALTQAMPEALAVLPVAFCQANLLLPIKLEEGVLWVATADPQDRTMMERARFLAGRPLKWVLAAPQAIEDAQVIIFSKEAERLSVEASLIDRDPSYDENAIVKLAHALMQTAIGQRASDLHIQPFMGAYAVRIRVDGSLRRLNMLPDIVAVTLIRHMKSICGMDPTNNLMPQDGRMALIVEGRDFDMRVSTLPASKGERLVVRFLDQGRVHRLGGGGFSLAALQSLRRIVGRPSGLVLMTGPTGCGKTSTLYALLAELNRNSSNIITVEDPVEYRIPGVSQVEVNNKAGRSFAAVLRSILRQDPDILLVGEIRDGETAEIAVQAALTGHLVLSTLHTNDAITAIPRLLNLGVMPSILADGLIGVIAQRLCRALCPACRAPVVEPLSPEERMFSELTRNRPAYRPVGCAACDDTGYRGRIPIVDIIEMNKGLRDAIANGESRLTVLDGLRTSGLKSLAASGSLRVISGETTVSEVIATVGPSFWYEVAQHYGTYFEGVTEELAPPLVGERMGVLLMSEDAALGDRLKGPLENLGFRLALARTAADAEAALRADENLCFIIGDVPESEGFIEATERLRNNRKHISWARLPAAVLLPSALSGQIEQVKLSGVMGELMTKPVDLDRLLLAIRRAQAR